jgi:AmpD protein
VAPGRKTDPGIHFDWQLFAKLADISEKEMPYGTQKR